MSVPETILHFYLRYDVSWDDVLGVCAILLVTLYFLRINGKDPHYDLWFERPQAHLTRKITPAENDIAKTLRESDQDIVVFYGTQSGTSQHMAQKLGQAIDRRFSRQVCVGSLSEYDSTSIAAIDRKSFVVFILSTYGEGDPPDNAVDFAEWLRSDLPKACLAGLRFAMLGLGSSNYKWYNQFSRNSFDLLRKAGAVPALDLFLADDAQGMVEEAYFNWTTELFHIMVDKLGIPERPRAYEPSLEVQISGEILVGENAYIPTPRLQGHHRRVRTDLSPICSLPIVCSRCLTDSANRPMIHLDIDISEHPELKYVTGDHIAIWPENKDAEVNALSGRLGIPEYNARKCLVITKARPTAIWNPVWGGPVSIHALLKRHLEIAEPLSREFIQDLKQFAPSASAKAFLQSVSSDKTKYMQYRSSQKITLASVLEDACPDELWQIPISFILERIAPLRPRYYSIASAASVQPRRMSITVSVTTLHLQYPGELVCGLASHYLSAKLSVPDLNTTPARNRLPEFLSEKAQNIFCQIQKSKFRMPATLSRPIIMIATGTGIAPFRGFIQHAVRQNKLGQQIGQLVLLFGCRNPGEHLYREEFESAAESLCGKLSIHPAYSRFGETRNYVQDKIKQEQDLVDNLMIDEDASLYICGSTAMARGVSQALGEILCRRRDWSTVQYATFESDRKRLLRWQEDIWG